WVTLSGWSVAAVLLILWVALDFQGFKSLFTRKGTKYGLASGLVVILGLFVIGAIAKLSTVPRFNKSIDVSSSGRNTLAPQTVKILDSIKEKSATVELTAFFQDQEQKEKFRDLVSLYSRSADVLEVQYVDPQVD